MLLFRKLHKKYNTLAEQRTLERKVGRQHANVVEWNLSRISVVKVDTKQHLIIVIFIIIIIVVVIIAGRLTDRAWMKTGELLAPVGADSSADRQLRPQRRTDDQHLVDTHTRAHVSDLTVLYVAIPQHTVISRGFN